MPRLAEDFLLFDREMVPELTSDHFEPDWLHGRKAIIATAQGRGTVFFARMGEAVWTLRRYLRGGWMARFNRERYLWLGLHNSRPWREWHLLAALHEKGLPVPRPIAARVRRTGLVYRGDLITERIEAATSLGALMKDNALTLQDWQRVGALLASFHEHGVRHDDINVSNILRDAQGRYHLIDFDKAWIAPAGVWRVRSLARLRRSIDKLRRRHPACAFAAADWNALLEGYDADESTIGVLQGLLKKEKGALWGRTALVAGVDFSVRLANDTGLMVALASL